jgi:hypothetical protein
MSSPGHILLRNFWRSASYLVSACCSKPEKVGITYPEPELVCVKMCAGRFWLSKLEPTREIPPGRIPILRGSELPGLAPGDGTVRRRLRAPDAATSSPMRRRSFCETKWSYIEQVLCSLFMLCFCVQWERLRLLCGQGISSNLHQGIKRTYGQLRVIVCTEDLLNNIEVMQNDSCTQTTLIDLHILTVFSQFLATMRSNLKDQSKCP